MPENHSAEFVSNRDFWNNLAGLHPESSFYDVPGFLAGESTLSDIERDLLGEVRGKSVLHLQCHFGLDSLSITRQGASMTGVDFSEVAIAKARELNDRLGLHARFVCCDVNRLPEMLEEEFDIVFASFGVIGWHSDLNKWAETVAQFLKPEGRFCFAEFHPVLQMLNDDQSGIGYSYFNSGVIIEENALSYADPNAGSQGTAYGWDHSLGEVFGALEAQQLIVSEFKEYDYSPYKCFRSAVGDNGRFHVKGFEHMLPLAYSLSARKAG